MQFTSVNMDFGREQEDSSSDEIFSCNVRPYRPPSYRDFAENEPSCFYRCVDCGDQYFLESSLSIHLSRESVAITYFCKQCKRNLHYKNKCNLLAHLRQHPVNDTDELIVIVRPLSLYCEDKGIGKKSKKVTGLVKTSDDANIFERARDNINSFNKTNEDINSFKKTNEDINIFKKTNEDINSFKKTNEDINATVNPSKSHSSPNTKKGIITLTKIMEKPMNFPESNLQLLSTNAKSGEVKVIIRPQASATHNVSHKNVKCTECGAYADNIRSHFLEDNKPLNSRLRCPTCDFILPTKCSLNAHIRIHQSKPPFICPDCMKEFLFYELFMVHLKYFCFHLEKCHRFSCQACPGVFPTLTSLEVHLASKHVKPVYKCQACPRAFFDVKLLNEHKLQFHGGTKVLTKLFEQCQLCPQKLLTKNCLFHHVHEHVTSKNACLYCYKCSQCGFVTEKKLDFASHRLSCPDDQNDLNALAMTKLAKDNLVNGTLDENNSTLKLKPSITVCLPNNSSGLNAGSSLSMLNGKMKNISVTLSSPDGKAQTTESRASISKFVNQTSNFSQEDDSAKSLIPQRVYKACGWHPHKCLICRNELVVGTLQAWKNVPNHYEGCCKWRLGSTIDNSFNSFKVVPPSVAHRKSLRKNYLALNGPSNTSKLGKISPFLDTYLCHICNHSLQIEHSIIQKHFRQQHPDVEIMSLKPLVRKLDFSKSKVPLELLRFSVKTSKMLQVMVDRSKGNTTQALTKKNMPQGKRKQVQNGRKRQCMDSVKPWLRCGKCSFKTKNKKVYRSHANSHKIICYECKECHLQFVSEPSYKIHLVMHHGMKERKKLKNSYTEVEMTESQVKSSNGDTASGKLKCKVCHKSFTNIGDLQKHFRIHGMAFLMLNKDEKVWRKM